MTLPQPSHRPPAWFTIVILVMLLPLFSWPAVISALPADNDGNVTLIVYLFPIFAILSAWCAYRCFVTRKELSVILLAILLLAYIAVALLLL